MERGSLDNPGINWFKAEHHGYAAVSNLAWTLLGSFFPIVPINDLDVVRRDALCLPDLFNIIEFVESLAFFVQR